MISCVVRSYVVQHQGEGQLQKTYMTFVRLCVVIKYSLPICKKIQLNFKFH
jgi:hypothetical protein